MKKHEAITALKDQAKAVQAFGATALYLFGSTARDTASQTSDIDLFIDYDRDIPVDMQLTSRIFRGHKSWPSEMFSGTNIAEFPTPSFGMS
jgi:tRNA nucleotidyltransferase (CCA-adding enzyme)